MRGSVGNVTVVSDLDFSPTLAFLMVLGCLHNLANKLEAFHDQPE